MKARSPKLLMLNWRDPWHPKAGGAEVLTHRILERLVSRGWSVEWFSGSYEGARASELRDGISFVRAGGTTTVHALAFKRYARTREFNVIVDQVNTIPFYTPFYSAPSIAWFQQLAREVWLYEGGLLGPIGYGLEPLYLAPYRNTPLLTISASSAQSLRSIGLRGPIRIITNAVDEPADETVPTKRWPPDVLVVGRLTPSKRVEEAIKAAALMKADHWEGRLRIIGSGPARYRRALQTLATSLGVASQVEFCGRVDDAERGRHMREASVLWMTSVREGWGLVVTEAARRGTPAVVYDVPGLRDSVNNGVTGFVVPARPAELRSATLCLLSRHGEFACEALSRSRALNWEATTDSFAAALVEFTGLRERTGLDRTARGS